MNNQDQPFWRVIKVTDTSHFEPGRAPERAKRVDFQLNDGTNSYVIIPESEFDPDKVNDLIHNKAMQLMHVLTLEGPPVSQLSSQQ